MSFFRKAQKALEKEKALEKDKEKALEKEKEKQSSASQNGEGQSITSYNIESKRSDKFLSIVIISILFCLSFYF